MPNSLLITVDGAASASHISAWLPVLITAGFQRATLFHAVCENAAAADTLDALRPLLDRLAVTLSGSGVETDVALKRGDVTKWLTALAELRHSDLIVASPAGPGGAVPDYLDTLVLNAPVPVLVLPSGTPTAHTKLFARPMMLLGNDDAELMSAAAALVHAPIEPLHEDTMLPDASMLVMGPAPAGKQLADLLGRAACPVLLFPPRVLGAPARAG